MTMGLLATISSEITPICILPTSMIPPQEDIA